MSSPQGGHLHFGAASDIDKKSRSHHRDNKVKSVGRLYELETRSLALDFRFARPFHTSGRPLASASHLLICAQSQPCSSSEAGERGRVAVVLLCMLRRLCCCIPQAREHLIKL